MKMKIGVLEGDYIGPETTAEALKVLKAVGIKYNLQMDIVMLEGSGKAYDKYGVHMPKHTLEIIEKCDALLKGPFGGPTELVNDPKWASVEKEGILVLRKRFNLHTNLRQTKVLSSLMSLSPIKSNILAGVDILIVRELVSGIYFGEKCERLIGGVREFSDTLSYNENEIRRVAIKAYECAVKRKQKVTLVAKSNILKSSVLWREVVGEVAKSYPQVTSNYMHVDNAAMQLILNPSQFDVILTSNMFGDILSDEASVIGGSIGLFPSASLGDTSFGLYEPIHGSAPSIAGKGIANPISMILSVALMLRHSFALEQAALDIEDAVGDMLEAGYRTRDLFTDGDDEDKLIGTKEVGDVVNRNL